MSTPTKVMTFDLDSKGPAPKGSVKPFKVSAQKAQMPLTEESYSVALSFQELAHRHHVTCTCGASQSALGADHPARHHHDHPLNARRIPTCPYKAFWKEWQEMSAHVWNTRLKHVPTRDYRAQGREQTFAE